MSGNEQTEGILKTAARAIGSAAGTVASVAGVHGEDHTGGKGSGKLSKKNKSRLPRRLKKAQKHAHNVA